MWQRLSEQAVDVAVRLALIAAAVGYLVEIYGLAVRRRRRSGAISASAMHGARKEARH